MTDKNSRFPSIEEMDARILRNLSRLQGYVETLLEEIEDPDKLGPGASEEDWRREAEKLDSQLKRLREYLESREEQK